jgi:hypothetical protein
MNANGASQKLRKSFEIPQLKSRRGDELKVSDACRRTADHSDVANVVRFAAITWIEQSVHDAWPLWT